MAMSSSPCLFSPIKLRELTISNRVFMSPMCQYSAVDGLANDWHLVHLGTRAVGGAGLVMTEASAVSPEGRISLGDTGIWNEAQADAWQHVTQFIKNHGSVAAIQIAHAGRKAATDLPWRGGRPLSDAQDGWQPVAPSAIAFDDGYRVPEVLSVAELARIESAFAEAAARAARAGFDVVEIHMAHGYLLHEFLSPLSNRRTDAYGGSLEGRMRFPVAVARAVRAAWPEHLPLFVRISATDWVPGAWDLPDAIRLARELKAVGVDLVDCSSGGSSASAKVPAAPGYQVPFAASLRSEAGLATGAVGLITSARQAEDILVQSQADAILIGRELLRNPYWPLTAARELGATIVWPPQYLRAKI